MKAVSLFSGIGGMDLGLERAGIETVLQCEIDDNCQAVLERHWPETRRIADVRDLAGWDEVVRCDSDSLQILRGQGADMGQAMTVGAEQHAVLDGVQAARGLGYDVVGVDVSLSPATVHANVAEQAAQSEAPRILIRVGAPLVDDVGLSPVPSAEPSVVGLLSSGGCPILMAYDEAVPNLRATPAFAAFSHGTDYRTFPTTEGADLVHGGFPCQPYSVAGKRQGEADERNGWPEFRRIVCELRPRWVLAENVPGLLSVAGGSYFGQILSDLVDLGYGVAWGIRDAQFHGVPQRRRRLFVLATNAPGGRVGAERCAQVLSLCESCGGNPETGRASREGTTGALSAGTLSSGSQANSGKNPTSGYWRDIALANPLGSHHRRDDLDHDTYVPDVAYALTAREAKGVSLKESQTNYVATHGVRRLTPLECERLMGFPDGWTCGQSDSTRYRQLGNAVVPTVAEWIGRRIIAAGDRPDDWRGRQ